MAKDKKDEEAKPEEEKKQKPEKPKKAGGGEMSFLKIIIIISVVLVVQVVLIIVLFKFFISPAPEVVEEEGDDKHKTEQVKKHDDDEEDPADREMTDEEREEAEFMGHEELKLFDKTEKFNTITKDFKWYVQIQLGFDFVPRDQEKWNEEHEGEEEEGGGQGAEGGAGVLDPNFKDQIKAYVNEYIGTVTGDQLMNLRDSLKYHIKGKLKKSFKEKDFWLRKVTLLEFTPAKA